MFQQLVEEQVNGCQHPKSFSTSADESPPQPVAALSAARRQTLPDRGYAVAFADEPDHAGPDWPARRQGLRDRPASGAQDRAAARAQHVEPAPLRSPIARRDPAARQGAESAADDLRAGALYHD